MSPLILSAVVLGVFLTTPFVITLSKRLLVLDQPATHKIHSAPTPRGGGLTIALFWLLGMAAVFPTVSGQEGRILIGLMAGAAIIVTVGLLDDFMELTPVRKLFGQILAAAVFWLWASPPPVEPLSTLVVLGWIVLVINAFNLVDGLDGLAAGLAAGAAALSAFTSGGSLMQGPALLLAGACLGFLPYNWRPAKIFMGDSGSLFLGFSLAALTVINFGEAGSVGQATAPIFFLALPLYDTFLTVVRRLINQESLTTADTDHFYNRLMHHGLSHQKTVVVTLLLAAMLSVPGLVLSKTGAGTINVGLAAIAVVLLLTAFARHYRLLVKEHSS